MESDKFMVAAVEAGNLQELKKLFVDYDSLDPVITTNTPDLLNYLLDHAIQSGQTVTADYLIDRGADLVNDTEGLHSGGISPLSQAVQKGNKKFVELLINHGADINVADMDGWVPLHHTALTCNIEIASMLVGLGADVNAIDKNGFSPLWAAHRSYSREQTSFGEESLNLAMMELLLNHGADINSKPEKSDAIIHSAISNGIPTLNEHPNDTDGLYAYSEYSEDVDYVNFLIEHGADINVRGFQGATPLIIASMYNRKFITTLLLENGADEKTMDDKNHTALDWAEYSRHTDIVIALRHILHSRINQNSTDLSNSSYKSQNNVFSQPGIWPKIRTGVIVAVIGVFVPYIGIPIALFGGWLIYRGLSADKVNRS